ncbi:MAG: UDP-N-acetylenolpyruvoylglucosamine reductase [Rickettsiales bacterium]|nr:UDP-N-acetylenolpyruvoylglucosamine reductase [Rickettsiales bacterium]
MKIDNASSSQNLIERLPKVRGAYRESVELSRINWFNVGGLAEVVFRPLDVEDLAYFLREKPLDIPVTVLGVGSNLLVRDGGIPGVVIRLGRGFADIRQSGKTVHAGAAALSFNVATVSAEYGLAGLEFMVGIPGTVGGGLAMNGGAYGADFGSVLERAEAVDEGGNILDLSATDFGFMYRGHTLPEGIIFTKAIFKGTPDQPNAIRERLNRITEERAATQPIKSRTSGSTFKNPAGHKAWQLIDEAGCRGLMMGGAQVSEKHCNFLINTGTATAADIENLGEEVRRRVKEKSGITLEWEIKRIGKNLV